MTQNTNFQRMPLMQGNIPQLIPNMIMNPQNINSQMIMSQIQNPNVQGIMQG